MPYWRCPECRALYGGPLFACPRCRQGKGLVMALNVCAGCTTSFAVGLLRCPHCGSKDYQEDGQMPKITLEGGPSNAAADAENPRPEPEQDVSEEANSPAESETVPLGGVVTDQGHTPEAPAILGDGEMVADAATVAELPKEEPEPEREMTLAELRSECDRLGIPSHGNKAALRERLSERLRKEA